MKPPLLLVGLAQSDDICHHPRKVEAKLALASEDGIDQAELTKSLDGFTPTLNGFLMKLFVEKSDRPTIEMLQQDEWLSKNESKQGVFNNVYYRECRYD